MDSFILFKCLIFIFRNLARSIREKATDMALGLVQPRSDTLKGFNESMSPRHSRRQRLTSITVQKNPINVNIRYVFFFFFYEYLGILKLHLYFLVVTD